MITLCTVIQGVPGLLLVLCVSVLKQEQRSPEAPVAQVAATEVGVRILFSRLMCQARQRTEQNTVAQPLDCSSPSVPFRFASSIYHSYTILSLLLDGVFFTPQTFHTIQGWPKISWVTEEAWETISNFPVPQCILQVREHMLHLKVA